MFKIRSNGIPFTEWESVKIMRSIDNPSGAYQFIATSKKPLREYPIQAGNFVQILVNDIPKITGFVDRVVDSFSKGSHLITITGRDTTQDIIDSDLPDEAKNFNKPISFKGICLKVIRVLESTVSPVTDVSGVDTQFTIDELFNAQSGRNAMEFLVSFARKKQVYLLPDGTGGMLIFRPNLQQTATEINHTLGLNRNANVLDYVAIHSHEKRYNVYNTKSQDNFSFFDEADYVTGTNNDSGLVIDSSIRKGRYLERQSEELMSDEEVIQRTKEQLNISRALSTGYRVTVQGALQSEGGDPWDIGLLVRVNDVFAGLLGLFLIKTVEFRFTIRDGITTRLTCVPPEAYLGTSDLTVKDTRRNIITGKYQRSTPPDVKRFIR